MATKAISDLKRAIEKKDKVLFYQATKDIKDLNVPQDQVLQGLGSAVKADGGRTTKWLEGIFRPPKAMQLIALDENAAEWEKNVVYGPVVTKGALDLAWSICPHAPPDGDPWDDKVSKVGVEIINNNGWVANMHGMAARAEWVPK
mmetsp:Transcript_78709/g.148506  ORF Transcript_78709/g.148506 Transcript_78709/m.148506 type:complete len:145 (-) Transcript_78709:236-670(-)